MSIPLDDIERLLATGWFNVQALDLSRLIEAGQVVTIVLSDAPFEVPSQVGGANVLGSRQKQFSDIGLVKVRVLARTEEE